MTQRHWQTYEEVAAYLLNQIAAHFGVGHFEGKQVVPGSSGTTWEIDAKGCTCDASQILVVECKRHTKAGISQAIVASLAWTIRDVGARGGILVSPLGLQEGARKVAQAAGIVEVFMDKDSTTTDFFLKFLNQIHAGYSESLGFADAYDWEVVMNTQRKSP